MGFTNANQQPVRDWLTSVKREAMKIFRVYDSQNRLVTQYEAPTKALNGDGCIMTNYIYDGTSNRIIAFKETMTTWSSTWDF